MLNSNVLNSVFSKRSTLNRTNSNVSSLGSLVKLKRAAPLPATFCEHPHPQDIYMLAFIASSFSLRTRFLEKAFTCKLAVPFILPRSNCFEMNSDCLLNIILQTNPPSFKETSAPRHSMNIISFVRISDSCAVSKSLLLNELLSGNSGRYQNIFFTRKCPFGDTRRIISNGMVEAAWYLPSGKDSNAFTTEVMFLNLRGNAYLCPTQIQFLGQFSSLVIVMMRIDELGSPDFKAFHNLLTCENTPGIILMLLPGKQMLEEVAQTCQSNFGGNDPPGCSFFLAYGDEGEINNTATLKNCLQDYIVDGIQNAKPYTIDEIATQSNMPKNMITAEQNMLLVQKAKRICQETYCAFDEHTEISQNMLPLQKPWADWVIAEKKSKQIFEADNQDKYLALVNGFISAKKESRSKQMTMLIKDRKSGLMAKFVQHLKICFESGQTGLLLCYAELIRCYLDEKSRDNLPKLNLEYRIVAEKVKAGGGDKSQLLTDLRLAETRLTQGSFSVNNLFREMGQIYEAMESATPESRHEAHAAFKDYVLYPKMMATLLIHGFPLELMDGDASGIPMSWISSIFECLQADLVSKKVLVVSVLGVQSSGKSTLLNSMFGVQFTVSAGRCTRGVYAQLVPAPTRQYSSHSFDYILVLDTEGIRALEDTPDSIKRDNEIATFVIGVSDMTLLNMKGEQYSDVQDVMQIAVHAFLRMHLQSIKRRCIIMHQMQ